MRIVKYGSIGCTTGELSTRYKKQGGSLYYFKPTVMAKYFIDAIPLLPYSGERLVVVKGYTYDEVSVPPRVSDIRGVIQQLDDNIGAVLGVE